MAITRTSILSGNDGTNGSSFVTLAGTPIAGQILMFAVVTLSNVSAVPNVPTLSGTGGFAGVTWTLLASSANTAALLRSSIWVGANPSAASGTVTINLAGQEQSDCCWSCWSIANASANSLLRQSQLLTGTGTAVSLTFGAAALAENAIFSALASDSTVTPGTGFTEIHDETRTSAALQTQEKLTGGGSTVTATIASTDPYAMVAVEIRASSTIAPGGIATTSVIGVATVSLVAPTISPAGISTSSTLGTPAITWPLSVSGIATSTLLGTPAITWPVVPGGISTTTQMGAPNVFPIVRGYFHGPLRIGEYLWAYDREAGLYDMANETRFRGDVIYPQKLRLVGHSWPVEPGMGVYYRDKDGAVIDLSEWVESESGDATLEVGAFARSLISSPAEPLAPRITGDPTIPGIPVFGTFLTGTYPDEAGLQKAQITAQWATPLNVDGSTIQDGAMYIVRWRRNGQTTFSETSVQWGTNSVSILELANGVAYDFTIESVDAFNPPNRSGQSGVTTVIAAPDTVPPSKPAPPVVAGEILSVLVTHSLGKATGGTFNLESDLARLEVHAGATAGFTTSATTRIGDIVASKTHLVNMIPVVRSFHLENATLMYCRVIAYDRAGNGSIASESVPVTPGLIPSAAIINLSADKISTGTITASIEMTSATFTGGLFRSAVSGQRVEMAEADNDQIKLYSGIAFEVFPGILRSTGSFNDPNRVVTYLRSNMVSTHASELGLFSDQGSGNPTTATLAITDYSATPINRSRLVITRDLLLLLLEANGGRRYYADASGIHMAFGSLSEPSISAYGTSVVIRRGADSAPSIVIQDDNIELRKTYTGGFETLGIYPGSVQLRYNNNDFFRAAAAEVKMVVGGFNRFVATNTANENRNHMSMDSWKLYLRAPGDEAHWLSWNSVNDAAELRGNEFTKVTSQLYNACMLITGVGKVGSLNIAQSAWRGFEGSDFSVVSDSSIKQDMVEISGEDALAKVRGQRVYKHGFKPAFEPNLTPKKRLSIMADEAPDEIRTEISTRGTDGSEMAIWGIDLYGQLSQLSAAVSYLADVVEDLDGRAPKAGSLKIPKAVKIARLAAPKMPAKPEPAQTKIALKQAIRTLTKEEVELARTMGADGKDLLPSEVMDIPEPGDQPTASFPKLPLIPEAEPKEPIIQKGKGK